MRRGFAVRFLILQKRSVGRNSARKQQYIAYLLILKLYKGSKRLRLAPHHYFEYPSTYLLTPIFFTFPFATSASIAFHVGYGSSVRL